MKPGAGNLTLDAGGQIESPPLSPGTAGAINWRQAQASVDVLFFY